MIGRQLENYVNNTLLPEQQQAMQQDQAAAAAAAAPGTDGGGGEGLEEEEGSRDSLDAMMEDLMMASQSTISFADMEETYPALAESKASSSSSSSSSSRGKEGAESSRGAASKAAFSSLDDETILVLSDDDDAEEEEEEEGEGGEEDKENMRRLPNATGRKASSMRRQQQQQQQSSVVVEVIDVSEDEDEDEQEQQEQQEDHQHHPNLKAGGHDDDDDSVLDLMSDSEEEEEEEEEEEVEVETQDEAKDRSNNSSTSPPPPPVPAPLSSLPPSSSSKGKGRKRKLFSPPKVYKQLQLVGGGKVAEEGQREGEEEEEEDLDGPMTLGRLHRLCKHFEGTQAEEWEVVLLLDRREHENNPSIERGLIQAGVRCELRVLQLGDMLWVARRQQLSNGSSSSASSSSSGASSKEEEKARKEREKQEVMLRYVIERKTVGDLAASIKDGRYKEQKGRMLGVGNEVDRAFYLVEGTFEQLNDVIRPPALRTALATTQVIHGLPVLRTGSLDQTILLLLRMHARIVQGVKVFLDVACISVGGGGGDGGREEYLERHLCALPLPPSRIISLGEYQEKCKKTAGDLSVRSMFLMQLCAIDKVSEAKSKAVVSVYPTPMALVRVMREMSDEAAAVALLAGLPVAGHRQSLGRVAAVNIYNVYR
jgi:ERCC4-type nuclease